MIPCFLVHPLALPSPDTVAFRWAPRSLSIIPFKLTDKWLREAENKPWTEFYANSHLDIIFILLHRMWKMPTLVIAGGSTHWYQSLLQSLWQYLTKLKMVKLCDSEILVLSRHPRHSCTSAQHKAMAGIANKQKHNHLIVCQQKHEQINCNTVIQWNTLDR